MEAGRRIGKYVLDERIAVGGMAEVWAAHAEGREGFVKPVALKFILESFTGDPELERLFVNEARIAARLQHANLVTVFDFDKIADDGERGISGRYYIAMERVEGQDLRRLVEAARRAGYVFPVGMALYVAGEMLKALRYVHDRRDARGPLGLVHRDVSPHNVLVGYTGEVKLSDFGIAKAREHSARNTKPGSLRGKIAYASPEQLAGGAVDHRTDQFAAAVTIWELLAGRRLFEGASDLEIIGKVARCEIPALADTDARSEVPPAVEAVLRRMPAAEPRARSATTAAALSAVLALPGYSPDGASLGELVRALFTSPGAGLSRTVPLQLVGALGAGAATRTMDGAPAPPPSPAPERAAPPSVALASYPIGAEGEGSTTANVRAGVGVARFLGALVFGAAVAALVLARHQLGFGTAPAREVASSPRATPVAVAPPVAVALPVPGPPPVARPATPPTPPSRDEARAPIPDARHEPPRASRVEHAQRHRAERAATAPSAATPAAPAAAPEAAPTKSSSNGAPIIE